MSRSCVIILHHPDCSETARLRRSFGFGAVSRHQIPLPDGEVRFTLLPRDGARHCDAVVIDHRGADFGGRTLANAEDVVSASSPALVAAPGMLFNATVRAISPERRRPIWCCGRGECQPTLPGLFDRNGPRDVLVMGLHPKSKHVSNKLIEGVAFLTLRSLVRADLGRSAAFPRHQSMPPIPVMGVGSGTEPICAWLGFQPGWKCSNGGTDPFWAGWTAWPINATCS
jgi:hypothetical protein